MVKVLTSRRWLGAFGVALAFAVAAYFLGQWQWHRYEAKAARADRIHAHYDAKPRPVADVLTTTAMPLSEEWTRVTMQGRYAADETLLVRNRPFDGTYGYEVLVPFLDSSGATVLVDRGWVMNAKNAETLPALVPSPAGTVTVTGWLRRSEPSLGKSLPAGQLASINLGEASRQVGSPLLGAYVVLGVERLPDGTAPDRPTALEPPDTDLGPHQAYAFQWWFGMVAGFVLVWLGARREYLESDAAPERAEPARPKKVRIWDEEDA
ncbi:SURF1 family protein [Pedococcus bigeumensis]|uniref:SURF1-like protein n=1 Tax=Pedococcus bigeumensis TaxID=433644 RepID=A0A502D1P0_9MICO|nr:SURF1 family protein [Pedococcus bigeumensis]TPG17921.1 SURF1 family protein [Pedococcus bigeumensis]